MKKFRKKLSIIDFPAKISYGCQGARFEKEKNDAARHAMNSTLTQSSPNIISDSKKSPGGNKNSLRYGMFYF